MCKMPKTLVSNSDWVSAIDVSSVGPSKVIACTIDKYIDAPGLSDDSLDSMLNERFVTDILLRQY
jgi:hypothetical protein